METPFSDESSQSVDPEPTLIQVEDTLDQGETPGEEEQEEEREPVGDDQDGYPANR